MVTKKQKIKILLKKLNELKNRESRKYIQHQIVVTPAEIKLQTELAEVTNEIILLRFGK